MNTVPRLSLMMTLLALGCIMAPDLDKYGYTACGGHQDCVETGRLCQSGYCTPPDWWDAAYAERRQITLRNTSDRAVPKGFPLRLGVGPDPRPFKREEFSATARLVAIDRAAGAQVEQKVTVDVLSSLAFDVIVPSPAEIPAGGVLKDIYLYSAATPGTARTDARDEIFPLDDDFEADLLSTVNWRTEGAVNLVDGEAVVLRTGYLWSNLELPATPGVLLTVEFQTDVNCDGLTLGLISNSQRGYRTPAVVVTSSSPGEGVVQAQRADNLLFEPDVPTPFLFTGATQRLDMLVSGADVRVSLDGTVVESVELEEPITDDVRAHFFVDGASCTLSIKKMRMRPALGNEPDVVAERKVLRPE